MQRGEIWLINLSPTVGAEIQKARPVVIVNDDDIGIPGTFPRDHRRHYRRPWYFARRLLFQKILIADRMFAVTKDTSASKHRDQLTPERRSWNMSRIRGKNTNPEITVRRLLHRLGYRFRLHVKNLPGKPDIVLPNRNGVILIRRWLVVLAGDYLRLRSL